jgi:hypothetical protein
MANLPPDLLMQQIHEYIGRAKPAKCWHEAPFDKRGNQVSYPDWNCEMRPVEQFEDELTFVEFVRGRSAANAIMRRSSGETVSMFLHDFEPLVRHLRGGKIEGLWIYVKRGANYGVAYA